VSVTQETHAEFDDGSHHSECEKVVQEFWDYDTDDRAKAIALSHDFKLRREEMLQNQAKKKQTQKKKKQSEKK
jgi:N-acetylglucosamine-6-sulfatase